MKKKFISVFVLSVALFSFLSCQAQTTDTTKQTILKLREFYSAYITETSKSGPPNESKLIDLKKKYCTSKLLNKIDQQELDYDPFLKAQDSDIAFLKTLSVTKSARGKNTYTVSYIDAYSKSKIVINVGVVYDKDIKIASVL